MRLPDTRSALSYLIVTGAFVVSLIVLLNGPPSAETVGVIVTAWLVGGLGAVNGFWLSDKASSEKATENTGKAFDAIKAAQMAQPPMAEEKGEDDAI